MSEEVYMVKFINRITGTAMWISEDRVEEYKAAGHRPAALTEPRKVEPKKVEIKKPAPKKSKTK